MSSTAVRLMRKWRELVLALGVIAHQPLSASAETSQADGSISIDILSHPTGDGEIDPRLVEQCESQEDAARISGEIVVCRELLQNRNNRYNSDREDAERRYAEETAFRDAPATPNVDGPGIFQGEPSVGRLCIPGLQKCPPPPALIIDVTAFPQAPYGSDADRIARGLPPIGLDGNANDKDVLGLPPPIDDAAAASPAGSAEQAAER